MCVLCNGISLHRNTVDEKYLILSVQLLKLKEAIDASRHLDKDTHSYLEVYHHGLEASLPHFGNDAKDFNLENDALWESRGQTYSGWICKLAYTLLRHTRTKYLRVCAQMVCKLPSYFLLPVAFHQAFLLLLSIQSNGMAHLDR